MKNFLLLSTAVFAIASNAYAQSVTVRGEVVSQADGKPLIGATVMAAGTIVGTSTNIEGHFSLAIPDNVKTLRVSYVGMVTKEVTVTGGYLTVSLEEASTLDEVVVTGYGMTKKSAFTGAASVVSGEEIEKRTDVNFVKGLEGVVTGFQYNNSTSMPGAWGSVTVRGIGTLSSSSQPLYVVDGVPVDADYTAMSSTTNAYFDPLAAYNPNDIESVTVLKDAASTAIYGSRAANGVIVITTKKGSKSMFNLNVDVKQGLTSVANNNMVYADAFSMIDILAKGYQARTGKTYEDGYAFMVKQFKWDEVSSYDWMDAVTRTGHYQQYDINFSGTSGQTHYYASLGYVDTEGVVIGSSNERYSGRLNLDTSYKFFSAGANVAYSYSENNNFSQSTSGTMTSPLVGAVSVMTPFYPYYNAGGGYYGAGTLYNPLAITDKKLGDINKVNNQTFIGNPWLRINLPFGVWAKTALGINIVDQSEYNYWSGVYNPQGVQYNGLGKKMTSRTSTITWTNTVGWNKTFNNVHSFDVMLGQEMQRYEFHYDYYSRKDYPFCDSGMRDFSTAAADNGSDYYQSQSRLASYFLDAHYDYDSRYFISASLRRDGSSVFGEDHRWGNFWSVGAKWRISNEAFLEKTWWLSNADLRLSYGTVGNQSLPSLYAARGYYAAGYNYSQNPGIAPEQISNPDLTWETSRKFDVGFDLTFLNRLNLTFDFFNEVTSDALYKVPLSMTTGINSYYKNIGKMGNRGVEIGLNGVIFTNRNFTISAFANISTARNRVLKLADGPIEASYQKIDVGRPYRFFFMPEYAGVDPETGRALYYLNEEGDETTDEYTEAAKRFVGSPEPKLYGAFGINAGAFGFDFSMQFNYREGNKVYNSAHNNTGWGMQLRTPLQVLVDNSWTPENPDAKYPQFVYGDPYMASNGNHSSRYVMDGSYIRLSNISFGYTLPAGLTRKALLEKVRIYTNFDNVHTWTRQDFIGYNPDTYANGVIAWQYPAVFTFTAGIQLTF